MSVAEQPKSTNLIARVQNILLRPMAEWDVIAAEPATPQSLFLNYACILAAIPAVCLFVGMQVFGIGAFGFSYHPPLIPSLIEAVVDYVLSLAIVYGLAFLLDALAPSFGSEKNIVQALKLTIYSYTASWVAGVVLLVPMLGLLVLLAAIYGFYLFWVGLPKLMKTPDDKRVAYVVVYIVAAVIAIFVVRTVENRITPPAVGGGTIQLGSRSGDVRIGSVDLGKLQAAAQQAESAAKQVQSGDAKVVAIDPEKLKGFLPDNVAGLPRTEVSAESAQAGGLGGSNAEGTYEQGERRITLKVTDIAAMSGFAAMAGAVHAEESRETATGYEKASNINGRWTKEQYDNQSKYGEYSVLVASRFEVEADGNGVSMDDLKAAVSAVGPDRLEGLAHG